MWVAILQWIVALAVGVLVVLASGLVYLGLLAWIITTVGLTWASHRFRRQ